MLSGAVVTELAFRPRRLPMRTLDERLAIRFPRLLGFVAGRITRLPLRSRIRRYLVARRTCQGFQAVNRGDLDLLLAVYHEDVTTTFDAASGFVPLDLAGEHAGRDGFKRLFEEWGSTWNDLRVEPRELIDAGDRLIVTVDISGTGKGSGAPAALRYFDVYTLRGGQISRHEMFADRAAALSAAGVSLD
jgi:ketosteroid isomerase-like protein